VSSPGPSAAELRIAELERLLGRKQLEVDFLKRAFEQVRGAAPSRTSSGVINDFITWYCSEPRLAFGCTVVLRYRYEPETRRLAPATINLRLAAVRRLAYEAADNGLLSPDLAASIRRVKGAKKLAPARAIGSPTLKGAGFPKLTTGPKRRAKETMPFWPSCSAAACGVPS
jgi:hypothetical protein